MPTTFTLIQAIISIVFGLLVVIFPRFLNYIVGLYFIIIGLILLLT
ncbi:DUF3096 domain-containing protein [Candidatus Woesearchaeota archaeon]|nr:DUF3096 domain-containing protein [Candidatus Woesearchaeota archaeon]